MTLTTYFMEATYLVASILFILALKMMSHPDTARRGMFLAEGGMLLVNWPFLFAIRHRATGLLLFAAKVCDPGTSLG